jgi:hypothetical protein
VVLAPPPELRQRDGMEGARGHLTPHAESRQPIAQLPGGLARERDRKGVGRVDVRVAGLPGDAARQDPRLARAGTGQDRQRRRACRDGFTLRVVQALEQDVFGHPRTIPIHYDRNEEGPE